MSDWGVVDFFCGCGGTSAGLEKAGMDILAGIDIDQSALDTYKINFPKAEAIHESVTTLSPETLNKKIKTQKKKHLVFAACAPCQPFSTQNRLKNKEDERVSLLGELCKFVKHCSPDYIVLENVPGMQKAEKGPFTLFLEFLKAEEYSFDFGIKNAVDYGVPQSRKRLVLIAAKKGSIALPEETHGKGKLPYKTVKEAISKYPSLKAGSKCNRTHNHQCAKFADITMKRIKHTPEGGDRRNWPDHLILDCHRKHTGHNDVYGRLWWDKPSVTLTTKCVSISNGRFGHPEQDRALSVREAAALQTFDDDFIFVGTLRSTAQQVGNAVPVDFAKALGKQIIKHSKGL
ncbi:MAG: DNA (cytosine-5-)-methyltransferase [Magnetococcales bacterium]|nr:DNA (cytosine-5-)-methyltransferase [Magnetococcales bacterium]MAF32343.1 DNA (cytosine-5-)-methyltransferase [Magnetococcales bacterium]|tara:strand:+ start:74579 stop:75613 length:1035 start_codon:yes stop_codon:yes gene_type:complete